MSAASPVIAESAVITERTALESRYRAAMRWYPDAWRDANEDALVGTLLDGAEAERRQEPLRGEVLNLALNGVLTRGGFISRLIPARVRDRTATLSLGLGFGVAVVLLVSQEWAPWSTGTWPNEAWFGEAYRPTLGPFAGWGAVLYLSWVLAFLFGIIGWTRATRLVLASTIVLTVGIVLFVDYTSWSRPSTTGLAVLAIMAFMASTGTVGRHQRGVAWLAVTGAAGIGWTVTALSGSVSFTDRLPPRESWLVLGNAFPQLVLIGAILLVVAMSARNWTWVASLLFFAAPWALLASTALGLQIEGFLVLIAAALLVVLSVAMVLYAKGFRVTVKRRS